MESLKRLVGVLFAPTETFRKIAERPTWAVALVVLLMLGAAVGVVVAQKLDLDAERDLIRQQIEDRQGLRGDELESQVDRVANINSKIRPFTPALVVVFGTGIYLLVSLIFMVGTGVAGGEIDFRRSFATTLHGMMPQGLSALIALPLALSRDSIDPEAAQGGSLLVSSLSFLAPEDASAAVESLLGSLDLFTLWSVILLTLGYSVVGRLSKGAAAGLVVGAWVVWIAAKMGLASLFG
jgi:hypothetical protein